MHILLLVQILVLEQQYMQENLIIKHLNLKQFQLLVRGYQLLGIVTISLSQVQLVVLILAQQRQEGLLDFGDH